MFVRVISEPFPVIYIFLNWSICLSRKYFPKFLAISVPFLAIFDKIFPKISMPQITPPDCTNFDNWVFENFILADQPFAKALRVFETYVSFNNNLYGKLFSSLELPIKTDERFKFTSVPFLLKTLTY